MRRFEVEVSLEYDDPNVAEAVAKAVSPDNIETPEGLFIETTRKGNRVVTNLSHSGKFSTFVATIDDLLSSASTAERAIQTLDGLE